MLDSKNDIQQERKRVNFMQIVLEAAIFSTWIVGSWQFAKAINIDEQSMGVFLAVNSMPYIGILILGFFLSKSRKGRTIQAIDVLGPLIGVSALLALYYVLGFGAASWGVAVSVLSLVVSLLSAIILGVARGRTIDSSKK